MSKLTPEQLLEGLQQCSGSETIYRHGLRPQFVYTEGVRFLAEGAGAYWLLDAIVSHQLTPKVAREDFQVWVLQRNEDDTWTLSCHDGNGRFVAVQQLEFSDFPLSCIEVWLTNNTLLLPSEY